MNRNNIMSEFNLNEIEKKEFEIKQNRLKALIDIESLADSITADADVDKNRISNYAVNEKNELFLDIINSLNIDDFDSIFTDTDGSLVNCTIENSLEYIINHGNNKILLNIYDELVSVLANYDITELVNVGIIHNYLKMINTVSSCYDEIYLDGIKKNT